MSNFVFCRGCGKKIHETAISCPQCGAIQRATIQKTIKTKNRVTGGILALLLADNNPGNVPGLLPRLGAQLIDFMILLTVWFLATALVLPLNQGQAFEYGQWLYLIYLLLVSFVFYAWFWTHGGQTLGMRVWKIQVLGSGFCPVTWKHALLRFFSAGLSWLCLGLGHLWCLVDREGLSWHDKLSNTHLLVTGKPDNDD